MWVQAIYSNARIHAFMIAGWNPMSGNLEAGIEKWFYLQVFPTGSPVLLYSDL
jgi:hypothetical protein